MCLLPPPHGQQAGGPAGVLVARHGGTVPLGEWRETPLHTAGLQEQVTPHSVI